MQIWPYYQLSIARFASVSPWVVRAICGPTEASDSCLISLKTPAELWTAVYASDGRVYDAISLHTWLRHKNDAVIPTQPITTVRFCPWPIWCAIRSTRALCMSINKSANFVGHFRSLCTHKEKAVLTSAATKPRRTHMLLQIVDTSRVYGHKPKAARRLLASSPSAFTLVEKRAQ